MRPLKYDIGTNFEEIYKSLDTTLESYKHTDISYLSLYERIAYKAKLVMNVYGYTNSGTVGDDYYFEGTPKYEFQKFGLYFTSFRDNITFREKPNGEILFDSETGEYKPGDWELLLDKLYYKISKELKNQKDEVKQVEEGKKFADENIIQSAVRFGIQEGHQSKLNEHHYSYFKFHGDMVSAFEGAEIQTKYYKLLVCKYIRMIDHDNFSDVIEVYDQEENKILFQNVKYRYTDCYNQPIYIHGYWESELRDYVESRKEKNKHDSYQKALRDIDSI